MTDTQIAVSLYGSYVLLIAAFGLTEISRYSTWRMKAAIIAAIIGAAGTALIATVASIQT